MTVVCKRCSEKRANADVILYSDHAICAHCISYYENVDDKKKRRKLNECDVYILNVSEVTNVSGRLIEWGMAYAMDKILLLDYDPNIMFFSNKLFQTLAKDSKRSFRHVSKQMRDAIISNRSSLETLRTYKEYKKYLQNYNIKENEELI
jgi:hypothetical protein